MFCVVCSVCSMCSVCSVCTVCSALCAVYVGCVVYVVCSVHCEAVLVLFCNCFGKTGNENLMTILMSSKVAIRAHCYTV